MSIEDRVRYLIEAAIRAEGEGQFRIARSLRRMADEARPLVTTTGVTVTGRD